MQMCVVDPQSIVLCASVGCGLASISYVAKSLGKLPHPSELRCIGSIYRISGLHTHDPLDIIIDVHEAVDYLENGKYRVQVASGRFFYSTSDFAVKHGKLEIYQKINVHIRQCDDKIEISLCKKGRWSYSSCGTVTISVEEEILAQRAPKRRTYTLVNDNRSASKLAMTIYKMDENIATMEITPLTLQVLIQSQMEGKVLEEDMLRGLEEMSDIERLRYFATVISGPLKKMNSIGKKWTEYFFKPLEISPGYWEWCYWKSLEHYESGAPCLGSFSFLAISVIVPDPKERRNFYIRYHNESGEHGMIFKRVDRDRDVWTDGMFEFVERVREVYLKNPKFRNLKKTKKQVVRCKDLDPGVRFEDLCKEVKLDSNPKLNFNAASHTLTSPVNLITPEQKTLRDNIQVMASNMYKIRDENLT